MRWGSAALVVIAAASPRGASADDRAPFVSGELVAGAVVKAQAAAGWGQPHTEWIGGEAFALSTTEFAALYGGVRGRLRFADVTLGVRETFSYDHPTLPVMDSYASTDGDRSAARYTSIDASLTGYAPVPFGYAMVWTDVVYVLGLSSTERVFEEYERVVVGAGATVAARIAYLAALRDDAVLVGPMVEGVWHGGRDARTWRLGGAAYWTFNARWSLLVALTTPVAGTDDLGAWDSLWGTAGVRYRWSLPRAR